MNLYFKAVMWMIASLQRQILEICAPQKIILFGSQAKGTATERSDIDICVIAETTNKRELLTDLYCEIDSEKPVDFLLYTPEEWSKNIEDAQSFAYKLNREGMLLYER